MKRTAVAVASLTLIGAFAPAMVHPFQGPCQADDAIPEFVTRRVELVSVVAAGDPRGAPGVELERDPACRRGLRAEP